jgi:hypothetical protein
MEGNKEKSLELMIYIILYYTILYYIIALLLLL